MNFRLTYPAQTIGRSFEADHSDEDRFTARDVRPMVSSAGRHLILPFNAIYFAAESSMDQGLETNGKIYWGA